MPTAQTLAPVLDEREFATQADALRGDLLVHCYRMLGGYHDAEDAVQETLARAWRGRDAFEGRASVRTWLRRIATRVCLDALDARPRTLPYEIAAPSAPDAPIRHADAEVRWLEPLPDRLVADTADPAELVARREHVSLAFVAALQLLPPRQRAVLILRDVLAWRAAEVAETLEMTPGAVNSALKRARAELRRRGQAPPADLSGALTPPIRRLLERYLRAWERADVADLVAVLRDDARLAMPPAASWYAGRSTVTAFLHRLLAAGGAGRWRLLALGANGQPAFAMYEADGDTFAFRGVQVLAADEAGIGEIVVFLEPTWREPFALPERLD